VQRRRKYLRFVNATNADIRPQTRWLVVAILDGATEIGIVIVTVWLVNQLQMKRTQKATVIAAFAWRLP
jgi:hypothetical protein